MKGEDKKSKMMDMQELKRLIREQYPFPIAHAHKKTLGVLDDDLEKLKCLPPERDESDDAFIWQVEPPGP
jgi:hypothetical protein